MKPKLLITEVTDYRCHDNHADFPLLMLAPLRLTLVRPYVRLRKSRAGAAVPPLGLVAFTRNPGRSIRAKT